MTSASDANVKSVGSARREAQAALNDAMAALQRGTYVAPTRTTLREFLATWHEGTKTELALTA
jgi:hypothetical protein